MRIWDVHRETTIQPRLFTAEAWATLSPQQRELIRAQRMAVVRELAIDHARRYPDPEAPHATSHHGQGDPRTPRQQNPDGARGPRRVE